MKNFQSFTPEKYAKPPYEAVEPGIYRAPDPYGITEDPVYVTSITFELEPECYGEEDGTPKDIPQVPIEGILDEFNVSVTDFYEELNAKSQKTCYQEFGSNQLEDIQALRTLLGKRMYAVPYEEDGEEYYDMVVEP